MACLLFINTKDYLMKNINKLLEDFMPTFSLITDYYSDKLANYFVPFVLTYDPLVEANLGLI